VLFIVCAFLITGCENVSHSISESDNTQIIQAKTHGEILSRGKVRAEINSSPAEGTIYECSCGDWHTAQGGEKLYVGIKCDNLNGNTYTVHLKSNSQAEWDSPALVSLTTIQGMVNYVDSNGNSQRVSGDCTVETVKVVSENNSSVWVVSSKKSIFSDPDLDDDDEK